MSSWAKELKAVGLIPSVRILEECPVTKGIEREAYWIVETKADLNVQLPRFCPKDLDKFPYESTIAAVERRYILEVLDYTQGNKRAACKILGIGRQTLYNRLATFDTTHDDAKLRRILDI